MLYRLRNSIGYGYYKYKTRAIRRSTPIPCDPAAECEVHTMLGARDFPLYLVAVKSLLRFHPMVAVVVHSDGSLDEEAFETILYHVPGSRIIRADEADRRALTALGEGTFLWRMRQFDASYRRLVDTELWSLTKKRIIMDADVLVLKPPIEVIDWIRHGDRPFLMGQPPSDIPAKGPGEVEPPTRRPKHVQTIFKTKLGEIASALGYPPLFLDGGTGGFYGTLSELTLDRVEPAVKVCIDLGIPMQDWGSDQCVIIFLLSAQGANRLDPDAYINFNPHHIHTLETCCIIHFYGTFRFYRNVYSRLSSHVARELSLASWAGSATLTGA